MPAAAGSARPLPELQDAVVDVRDQGVALDDQRHLGVEARARSGSKTVASATPKASTVISWPGRPRPSWLPQRPRACSTGSRSRPRSVGS